MTNMASIIMHSQRDIPFLHSMSSSSNVTTVRSLIGHAMRLCADWSERVDWDRNQTKRLKPDEDKYANQLENIAKEASQLLEQMFCNIGWMDQKVVTHLFRDGKALKVMLIKLTTDVANPKSVEFLKNITTCFTQVIHRVFDFENMFFHKQIRAVERFTSSWKQVSDIDEEGKRVDALEEHVREIELFLDIEFESLQKRRNNPQFKVLMDRFMILNGVLFDTNIGFQTIAVKVLIERVRQIVYENGSKFLFGSRDFLLSPDIAALTLSFLPVENECTFSDSMEMQDDIDEHVEDSIATLMALLPINPDFFKKVFINWLNENQVSFEYLTTLREDGWVFEEIFPHLEYIKMDYSKLSSENSDLIHQAINIDGENMKHADLTAFNKYNALPLLPANLEEIIFYLFNIPTSDSFRDHTDHLQRLRVLTLTECDGHSRLQVEHLSSLKRLEVCYMNLTSIKLPNGLEVLDMENSGAPTVQLPESLLELRCDKEFFLQMKAFPPNLQTVNGLSPQEYREKISSA